MDFRQPARLSAQSVQVVRHQRAVRRGELGAWTAQQRQRRPGLHSVDAQHGQRRQHRHQRRILLHAVQLYLRGVWKIEKLQKHAHTKQQKLWLLNAIYTVFLSVYAQVLL